MYLPHDNNNVNVEISTSNILRTINYKGKMSLFFFSFHILPFFGSQGDNFNVLPYFCSIVITLISIRTT